MQKSIRTKTENRILLNCNVRTIENWLKVNAAEGWLIEKKNGTEFQFKKVKPCQAEFLVLENFFSKRESKLMNIIRQEFFACRGVKNIGHADAALYSVYCVEIERDNILEIHEVRRKRNRLIKGQSWLILGFFLMLAIISIISTIWNQEPILNSLPIVVSSAPFMIYAIMVVFHLSGKKAV